MWIMGALPGRTAPENIQSRTTERARLVEVQTSASPSTTTKTVRARFHGRSPFRTIYMVTIVCVTIVCIVAVFIGLLERGKKSPSLRTIVSLATVLKTSGSELLKQAEALTKAT